MKRFNQLFFAFLTILTLISFQNVYAQIVNDGPIQLEVRLREVRTFFNASDQLLGLTDPDEMTYYVWARANNDVLGAGWQGGNCLQSNFNPSNTGTNSADFNTVLLNQSYPGAGVPASFDLRLEAWESDQVDPTCSGNRCSYSNNVSCGFGLVNEDDDYPCFANPFQIELNYRLGPPCQTYDHGFVQMTPGACANDVYRPRIQSYWRYTNGTSCANAIALGNFGIGSSVTHFNSNQCYGNSWPNSPGNDVFYSINVTDPIGITISLCNPAATFDTYLYLLDANCNTIFSSNDNSCGAQSQITTTICTPGIYTIVVDGATALAQGTFTLSIAETPSLYVDYTTTSTPVSCPGGSDGTASVTVTQGFGPYTYTWGPGTLPATPAQTGLSAGTYSVTVTDVNGCQRIKTITVGTPPPFVSSATGTDPICNGSSTGTISISVSGGTPPYEYSVDNGSTYVAGSTINNLPAGVYTITVRDDNNCVHTLANTVTLTDPPASIQPNVVITNISCNGLSDGSFTSTPTNGNPPYEFSLNSASFVSTGTFSNLSLGLYNLRIRDDLGCIVDTSFSITQPAVLGAQVSNNSSALCFGTSTGSLTIAATGGTTPYEFTLNGGTPQTSNVFSGLAAGNYTIDVVDARGCQVQIFATITQPFLLDAGQLFRVDVSCNGLSDGIAVVSASGGTPPYEFSDDGVTYVNNAAFSNLPGGTYRFYVRDFNGCIDSTDITVIDPAVISATATTTDATCQGINDGQLVINATGGTPPYRYAIAGGLFATDSTFSNLAVGTYNFSVRDANLCEENFTFVVGAASSIGITVTHTDVLCFGDSTGTITATGNTGNPPFQYSLNGGTLGSSGTFTNLPAGSYLVRVQDVSGCQKDTSINITQPTELVVTVVNTTNASCFNINDGSIDIDVTGGTGAYTYAWSGGLPATQDQQNIAGGTYTLTVTDANGCEKTTTVIVGQTPPMFVSIASIDNVTCNGANDGEVDITVNGGTPPYTFLWTTGAITEDVNELSGGNYTVTVTDDNGCSETISATVTESPALVVNATITGSVTCSGGSDGVLTVSVNGGAAPYSYSLNGAAYQVDSVFTNLTPGAYVVSVRDAEGCITSTAAISVIDGDIFTLDYEDIEITLGEEDTLEAQLDPSDTPLSSISWSPQAGLSCNDCLNPIASPGETTLYTVTATDTNGCSVTTTVTVFVNDDFRLAMPNIFSPNGSGFNDDFRFYSFGAVKTEVRIFNRWGAQVYYNPNQESAAPGWDGTHNGDPAPEGTYVYVIDVVYANGEKRQETGSITLIR